MRITVRLDDDTLKRLKEIAKKEKRSAGGQGALYIERAIREMGAGQARELAEAMGGQG